MIATSPTLKVLAMPGCTHDECGAKVRLPDGTQCCYWCYFDAMRRDAIQPKCEWCDKHLTPGQARFCCLECQHLMKRYEQRR